MSIFILKYTAQHYTYSSLQYWELYFICFFRFVSAFKLVYFSDLLDFKYAYFCL